MTDDDWFLPKRYGYGAGLPIAWQGWALLTGYGMVALVLSLALPPRQHPLLFAALLTVVTVPLLVIAARHTRGGWRWRWG